MNLDLTAAIEAATSALARELGSKHPDRFARPDATAAVTAAAPLIAAQVGEQIAAAIGAEAARLRQLIDEQAAARGGVRDNQFVAQRVATDRAAAIAREAVR